MFCMEFLRNLFGCVKKTFGLDFFVVLAKCLVNMLILSVFG